MRPDEAAQGEPMANQGLTVTEPTTAIDNNATIAVDPAAPGADQTVDPLSLTSEEPPAPENTDPPPTVEPVMGAGGADEQAKTALPLVEQADPALAEALGEDVTHDADTLEGDFEEDLSTAERQWRDVQQFIADGRARIEGALSPIRQVHPIGAPHFGEVVYQAVAQGFHDLMQHLYATHPAAPQNRD